jgi:hypothetical protein
MVYYYDYLSDLKDQVPTDIAAHIRGCRWCQRELHLLQEIDLEVGQTSPETSSQTAHLELHFALMDQPIRCSDIRAFLPVLAIPEQQVTIPTPVTVHIGHCRQCTEELKALKEMDLSIMEYGLVSQMFSKGALLDQDLFTETQIELISTILNRPDSGIVTTFHLKPSSEKDDEKSYEVNVSAQGVSSTDYTLPETPDSPVNTDVSPQRSVHRKWLLRPLAAAAVLVMGFFLLFQNESLKATDVSQIYEALKSISNVKMTQYGVDTPDPVQQIWVSHSLGMKLIETGDQVVMQDTDNRVTYSKTLSGNMIESETMSREMLAAVKKGMDVPWGLLPFNNVSDLPEGAVWKKVPAQSPAIDTNPSEVYDLFWTQETIGGSFVFYQWRCMLDPVTKRPYEIQWLSKKAEAGDYELTTRIEISYPEETQIRTILSELGFNQ